MQNEPFNHENVKQKQRNEGNLILPYSPMERDWKHTNSKDRARGVAPIFTPRDGLFGGNFSFVFFLYNGEANLHTLHQNKGKSQALGVMGMEETC